MGNNTKGDKRILGECEFVERVLRESGEEWEKRSLLRQRGVDLNRLMEKVAGHFSVGIEDLKSGSKVRNTAKARAVLCYVGVRKLGLTLRIHCQKAQCINPSTVSKAIVRAPQLLELQEIEEQLLKCQ